MAGVPGGQGLQQFGIGIFVAAGLIPDVTTPVYWAQSSGENVVRQERVVYDQTSTPVYVPPAPGTASVPLAYATRETQAVLRRVVYDPTSTPVIVPPTPTPSAFAYQPADAVWKRQRKVLPDGVAVVLRPPTVITPPLVPADASARIRRKINLPEGLAAPVTVPSTATATPSEFGYQTVDTTWRQQRKVLPEGFTGPISPPAAAAVVPGGFYSGYQQITVVSRRVVYDPGARVFVPVVVVATVTPSFAPVDAPQNWVAPRRIKPVQRSAFVFAYPVDDFGENYSANIRPKRKVLPDGFAAPSYPVVSVPPVSIDTTLASTHSSPVIILSRVVYDPNAARPIFPPAAPAAAVTPSSAPPDAPQNVFRRPRIKPVQQSAFVFAYPIDDLAADYSGQFIRSKRKVLPDGTIQPPFVTVSVAAVVTPAPLYQADEGAPTRRINRSIGVKLILEGVERPTTQQQRLFWFETYPAVKGTPINRTAVRIDLDGIERPPRDLPAVTPSYLFETIQPGWKATPNSKAIVANLNGIVRQERLPDPPVATPVNLFDNIGGLRRRLPNGVAITIDLNGAVWTPQDPRNLVGVDQTPPPVLSDYPIGGDYWHRVHKKKAGKTDKRCRWVTIDGVLTWICDRLTHERSAEARLQALDLVWDAEGVLEPLLEAVRIEQATNAIEAKRAAATLLLHAIHEAVIEDEDDDLLLLD